MRLTLLLFFLLCTLSAQAKPTANVKMSISRAENPREKGETLIIPYLFSTEGMGSVIGVGGMRRGFHQEQMTIGGTVFGGEESRGLTAGVWDYRFPPSRRLFISVVGMLGDYPRQRGYTSADAFVPAGVAPPGSNDSSPEAFIESKGSNNWWETKLEYALPIGAAKEQGMLSYQLTNGLLTSEPSGGEYWNPLEVGATVLTLRQYNRYQRYENEEGKLEGTIHAVELGLLYNNTDFPTNPSRGSSQYIAIHHDPAWLDSEDQWTFMEVEASKYFSLGASQSALQRVIAINAWTSYSPSWKLENNADGGVRAVDKPPFMEGATLGGFYRMRGYDQNRFHDKAALYSAVEYRHTLRYNPIQDIAWLRFIKLDWFQVVAFAEGGRVAPSYRSANLFKDWKSDVGLSLRALTAGIVVRLDVAQSSEGTNLWVMVGHPF